jgi:carbonic anhydrase
MKQFLLTIFILILISFTISTETKTQTSINKKMNSSTSSSVNSSLSTALLEMIKSSNTNNIGESPVRTKAKQPFVPVAQRPLNSNKLLDKEILNVEFSGWCKISSPKFKNPNNYPSMPLPDYSMKVIPLAQDNFRINEYYQLSKEKDSNYPPTELDFWFRYTDKNFYYTTTPNSLHVLSNLAIRTITDIETKPEDAPEKTCFRINDSYDSKWMICPPSIAMKNKWICRIKYDLGVEEEGCNITLLSDVDATVITQKISQPIIMVPLPASDCNENWNYEKNGENWDCDCAEGKEQSPIDLPVSQKTVISPVKPIFNYEEVTAKQTETSFEGFLKKNEFLKIFFDNGTIKIKHPNMGKVVTLDGAIYLAQDIVFHSPSEHKINGVSFDMEIQIIHYGQTKGDIAKQFILSFLVSKKPGVYNKFFDDIDFFNLPSTTSREREINKNIFIPRLFYEANEKTYPLMKKFNFYTYQGSLTAPPCTERTIHVVAEKPIELSTTTVALFKEAIKMPDIIDQEGNITLNTSTPVNNRKTQPMNGRIVYYYDTMRYEGPDPELRNKKSADDKKKNGHYERMVKKMTTYYHVTGSKPSGLPNTFVVSEKEAKGN